MTNVEVGQTIYVHHRFFHDSTLTVTKVGRLYATLGSGNYRLRLDGGRAVIDKRGEPTGTAYPSREAYVQEQERRNAWEQLQRRVAVMPMPRHITHDLAGQVLALLQPSETPT